MKERFDLLDLRFSHLSHENLVMRGGNIAELLLVHPVFQLPLPDVVVPPQQVKELVDKYRGLVNMAAKGGSDRLAERNEARQELLVALTLDGQYLQMVAVKRKDMSLLENSGFRVKSRSYSRVPDRQPEAAALIKRVKRGKKPGSLVVIAKGHPGKVNYLLSICKGDPVDESSWSMFGPFLQAVNELDGFELATKLSVRLKYDINGNQSDWSAPVGYIVT